MIHDKIGVYYSTEKPLTKGSNQQAFAAGTRNPVSAQIPWAHNLRACSYWVCFCTGALIYPVDREKVREFMRQIPLGKE